MEAVGSDSPGASCLIYSATVFLSAKHLSERSGTAAFPDFQSCCVASSRRVIFNLEWEQECTCPYPSDLTGSCWSSMRAAWGRALAGLDRGRLDLRLPSHTTTFNDPCLKLHLPTKESSSKTSRESNDSYRKLTGPFGVQLHCVCRHWKNGDDYNESCATIAMAFCLLNIIIASY